MPEYGSKSYKLQLCWLLDIYSLKRGKALDDSVQTLLLRALAVVTLGL